MSPEKPRQYWTNWQEGPGAADLVQISTDEFPEPLPGPAQQFSRRSFLKTAGFTAAVSALAAGCSRAPVEKAIPYLIQPEEIVPGVSYIYASTCGACAAGCGLLVKTREGRPVKLEGNPSHPLSHGGLCAVGQASLLDLYDSQRLKGPWMQGRSAIWEEVDRQIAAELAVIRSSGRAVRVLSGTISSPTLRAEMQRFLAQFRDARQISYDALSSSAILDAHEQTHGARILPRYRFDRAEVILGFDADFLGTWLSPVEFTQGYSAGRRLDTRPPRMSYHVQFESRLSLTGSKADRRIRVAPGELGSVLLQISARIARLAGVTSPAAAQGPSPVPEPLLNEAAQRLWDARGKSLVVCGSQDVRLQLLTNYLNHLLQNEGATVDLAQPSQQRAGNDRELQALLDELAQDKVAALFLHGVNPVFDLPGGAALAEALRKIPLVVSFAARLDETSSLARFVCPDHHPLESWGDAEPVRGMPSLFQPVISPLAGTRAVLESLAAWRGQPRAAYDTLRDHWRENILPRQEREKEFQSFWDKSVEAGFAELTPETPKPAKFRAPAPAALPETPALAPGEFSLVLYAKPAMLDGRHAHNPWLQELPDPISKVAWDNYACLSPAAAQRLGLRESDVIRLQARGTKDAIELPVYLQPGQHDDVVAVALGYGAKATERFKDAGPKWLFGKPDVDKDGRIGKNAAPLLLLAGGTLQYTRPGVQITKTGQRAPLACSQSHHTLTTPSNIPLIGSKHREIVQETTPAALPAQAEASSSAVLNGLWPQDHPYTGHRWVMVIDLTACTGCSACVVACQAENNIPVVGKDEFLRHREMQWMRIDRYYSGEDDVDVIHQPMLCQQCENAPCETVCPVLATVHSAEGLNQQIYNRCVGTRYCANNCPYKTRRFNWFNYMREDRLRNLALNPDVTVRSRGVMEKCTFCVQRIEAGRIEARRRGASIADGQIQTACQQSCPAQAIVFGDFNDPKSRVSLLAQEPRRFRVLEEFNFRPSVNYLALVRNRDSENGDRKENKSHG